MMRLPGVLRNAIANWLAFGVSALVGFFLAPFIVHRLGDSAYGVWVVLGSFVGYLGLLDFGVRGAVTRFVAESHARADHQDASVLVAAALRLFTVLAVVTLGVSGVLAALVDRLFDVPAPLLADARIVILLGGAAIAVSFIGGVYSGVVTGLQRFDLDGLLEIGMTLLRAVAVVVVLRLGYGLVALGAVQLGVSGLRGAIAFGIAHRVYPGLALRHAGPVRRAARRLLSFSIFSSLIQFAGMLIYYTDSFVIGLFLPIGMVTYYAIAGTLAEYARQLVTAVTRVIVPRASATATTGGAEEVRRLVLAVGGGASLLTVPIALTFLIRGERFITLWMGPHYAPVAYPVLALLALTVWFAGGRGVLSAALMGMNRHRGLAAAFAGEAVANLALSVGLIGRFGLAGVALGTAIPSLVISLGVIPLLLARHLDLPVRRTVVRVWLVPSLACSGFAAATLAVEHWFPTTSLWVFALQVAGLLPLVLLGAWRTVLSEEERNLVWHAAQTFRTMSRGFTRRWIVQDVARRR